MKESVRHRWVRAAARCAVILPLAAAPVIATLGVAPVAAAGPVTGAVSTTTNTAQDGTGHCHNGNEAISCNQYDGKQHVWLSGLPDAAGLNNGTYFFAVTVPGGEGDTKAANPNDGTPTNLSDTTAAPWSPGEVNADRAATPTGDSYTNRTFTLTDGVISYGGGHDFTNNKIRLTPSDDTTNSGGVYLMAVCQIVDGAGNPAALDPQFGVPGINPSLCTYDAFMVKVGATLPQTHDLTVVKDATGTYTTTYGWRISKSVDRSSIAQSGSSATVKYTVGVNRDPGMVSDVKVTGKITVTNPNPTRADGVNVSDTLSDNTACSVSGGSNASVPSGNTDFSYSCDLGSTLPSGALSSVASVQWPAQGMGESGFLLDGRAAFQLDNIAFAGSEVSPCVDVSDSFAGDLGQACGNQRLTYERTINGTAGTCTTVDDTATIVESSQAASATVKLCVGADLAVSKTAVPTFTRAYRWNIAKNVDTKLVEQSGDGTATFNYIINAGQSGIADSGWGATGVITIDNPNDWESVNVTSLDDVVDNGGGCTIDPSVRLPLTIDTSGSAMVAYSCGFLGGSSGATTSTAGWDKATASTPHDSAAGSAGLTFTTPTTRVNKTVSVLDTFNGITRALGTLTGTDSVPFASRTYTYPRTVNVPSADCVGYTNTAAILETGQHAGQSVKVCGPAKSGAMSMGFWQDSDGQSIIGAGSSVGTVCRSGAWLRGYAPYQDLSATATCAEVGTYVTEVMTAASSAATSMNPMLKAQMLATSLDVYFSSVALGGNTINAPTPIGGLSVDLTKICASIDSTGGVATCPGIGENVRSAFGGATSMTVSAMLAHAASQSDVGGLTWYGNLMATQVLAKDAFGAISNQGAFSP